MKIKPDMWDQSFYVKAKDQTWHHIRTEDQTEDHNLTEMSSSLCYRCEKTGHFARECPEGRSSTAVCYRWESTTTTTTTARLTTSTLLQVRQSWSLRPRLFRAGGRERLGAGEGGRGVWPPGQGVRVWRRSQVLQMLQVRPLRQGLPGARRQVLSVLLRRTHCQVPRERTGIISHSAITGTVPRTATSRDVTTATRSDISWRIVPTLELRLVTSVVALVIYWKIVPAEGSGLNPWYFFTDKFILFIMTTKVFHRENHYQSVLAFLNNHCLEEKITDITFICR